MFGKYTLRHQLFRLPALLILPVTFGLIKAASGSPYITEMIYSQKIYPFIRDIVAGVTSTLSFSLSEVLIVSAALAALVFLIIRVVRAFSFKPKDLIKLLSLIITYALTASYLFFLFYVMWGFNMYRIPVGETMDFTEREFSVSELSSVCFDLSHRASILRAGLSEDENGVFTIEGGFDAVTNSIVEAYDELAQKRSSFSGEVPAAKPIALSDTLTKTGIMGIYICYTGEANVNTSQPYLLLPLTAAHETAHYLGYSKEDEANFVAYLACAGSSDPSVAYSGTMHALIICVNRLYELDPEAYALVVDSYSSGMLRDLEDYNSFVKENIGGTANVLSDKINDTYLKFNGQDGGVDTYSEALRLILQYYDARGFFLVPPYD